jgi:hypothetical protein
MKKLPMTIVVCCSLLLAGCQHETTTSLPASVEISPSPVVSQAPAAVPASFFMGDVEAHAEKYDCWVVVEGGVYDVTGLVNTDTSAAAADVAASCGTDVTALVNQQSPAYTALKAKLGDSFKGALKENPR